MAKIKVLAKNDTIPTEVVTSDLQPNTHYFFMKLETVGHSSKFVEWH